MQHIKLSIWTNPDKRGLEGHEFAVLEPWVCRSVVKSQFFGLRDGWPHVVSKIRPDRWVSETRALIEIEWRAVERVFSASIRAVVAAIWWRVNVRAVRHKSRLERR